MAGRIPQPFIDELIARADIVEVIGSRVQLKKAGREWKACCPFHGEKTPSFTVSQQKQFYHCFGCGAHGTAIGFLMEYDKLSFIEAVEELATRLGLEIPREARAADARQQSNEDLRELMGRVSQYYVDCLKDDQRAIDYLKGRGLTGETAAQFRIGYAPDSWNAVLRSFGDGDEARRRLLAAGLTIERAASSLDAEGGFYDRFRDRIMFPIRDARGRVIAFGGRVLDKGEPKYLNSPETPVFHKGKELYGLYEARQSRQALKRLLIVEGYMDVVRLHQAGIAYAVATLGTATTAEHLQRIFRLTAEVVFCFDGDRAGRAAAWRALENALPQAREGRQIRFLFLPEGHDPDSLVGEEGREAFEGRLDSAMPLSEYLVGHLASQVSLEHVDGRARLAELARPLLEKIPAGIYRELLLDRLAEGVRMPTARLATLLFGDSPEARPEPERRTASGGASAERGTVVRQAIIALLNFPEAAKALAGIERLENIDQPGVPLLLELLRKVKDNPALTTGGLLEQFRDHADEKILSRLAKPSDLVPDARAAAETLRTSIDKLVFEAGPGRRYEDLLDKERAIGLTEQEKVELQGLLKARNTRQRPAGKP